MISPNEDAGSAGGGMGFAGPLAIAAQETLASFVVVTDMLSAVGNMAVSYGVGKPLATYQTLLKTYQTLLRAEDVLTQTANQIIETAKRHGGDLP